MLVLVDLEHDSLEATRPELFKHFSTHTLVTKYRLERLSRKPCLVVKYDDITLDHLDEIAPSHLIVGGQYTALPAYDPSTLTGLLAAMSSGRWPTFAVCGGFQLMATAFGATVGPIGEELAQTPHPNERGEIEAAERGWSPIELLGDHELLTGLDPQPLVFQLHSWEVKQVPECFMVLARTERCPVQMLVHRELPLVGTQFHAEAFDATYPAGGQLLTNFLAWTAATERIREG